MSEKRIYQYETVFEKKYEIEYGGKLGKLGDYEAVIFTVTEKKLSEHEKSEVKIKISRTLLAVWGINDSVVDSVLENLGLAKIYLIIENEEPRKEKLEYMFTTYGVGGSAQDELNKLNQDLIQTREDHKNWIENTRRSYFTNSDLILKIQKDHTEFQGTNAKELRSSMLQLSSISGVIVGAVVALGSNEIGQNWLILASLVLLSISTGLPFFYTTNILQDIVIGTFIKFKSIITKLEEINKSEFTFIREPSVSNYKATEDLWKKHSNDVRQNLNETQVIKKDLMLTLIQWCFTLGIMLLVASFAKDNFSKSSNQEATQENPKVQELPNNSYSQNQIINTVKENSSSVSKSIDKLGIK